MKVSRFKDASGKDIKEMDIVDYEGESYQFGLVVYDKAKDSWCVYEIPTRDLITNEVMWPNIKYRYLNEELLSKVYVIGNIFNRRELLNGLTPEMIIMAKER